MSTPLAPTAPSYTEKLRAPWWLWLVVAGISVAIGLALSPTNPVLCGILIGVAFRNTFIEFYQLQKSEAILASFLAMIPPSRRMVRDGSLTSIPADDLVKGDIVLVVSPIHQPFMVQED